MSYYWNARVVWGIYVPKPADADIPPPHAHVFSMGFCPSCGTSVRVEHPGSLPEWVYGFRWGTSIVHEERTPLDVQVFYGHNAKDAVIGIEVASVSDGDILYLSGLEISPAVLDAMAKWCLTHCLLDAKPGLAAIGYSTP